LNYVRKITSVISGFHRGIDEICALLGHYAALNNPLPTFRGKVSVPSSGDFLTLENGADTLSGKVGKGSTFDAL
jgi:hypothetical protein